MGTGSLPLGRMFWQFWSATALANIGDGIRLAAFPLLAASLTDSPISVAAVTAAQALPWLVTGLLAGSLADRRGARTLIVAADVGRVLVLATLVVAVATGWATISLVVTSAFLLGVGETLRDTAAQTAVPHLVPEPLLERANGRLVAGEIVGNEFVGPPAGAALFVAGAALPFAANGASLALAVMLVLSLPLTLARPPAATAVPTTGTGVRAGLRWLLRHRMLRALTAVCAAVAAADSAWYAIFVLYVRDTLQLGALGFGGLLGRVTAAGRTLSFSAAAAGALLGGALAARAGLDAPFLFSGLVAVLATGIWWAASRPAASRLA